MVHEGLNIFCSAVHQRVSLRLLNVLNQTQHYSCSNSLFHMVPLRNKMYRKQLPKERVVVLTGLQLVQRQGAFCGSFPSPKCSC